MIKYFVIFFFEPVTLNSELAYFLLQAVISYL